VQDLLTLFSNSFIQEYKPQIQDWDGEDFEFDIRFQTLLESVEKIHSTKKPQQPRSFKKTEKYKNTAEAAKEKDGKRKQRKWDDKISKDDAESLDYSENASSDQLSEEYSKLNIESSFVTKDGHLELVEMEENKRSESKSLFSFFKNFTGNKVLDQQTLEPVQRKMKEHLINKNVAPIIADSICETVSNQLVGQTVGSFASKGFIYNSLRRYANHEGKFRSCYSADSHS
jgi:signal recognition particle GTPase